MLGSGDAVCAGPCLSGAAALGDLAPGPTLLSVCSARDTSPVPWLPLTSTRRGIFSSWTCGEAMAEGSCGGDISLAVGDAATACVSWAFARFCSRAGSFVAGVEDAN